MEEARELLEKLRDEYGEIEAYQFCDLVFNSNVRTAKKTKQTCIRFLRLLDREDENSRYKFSKEIAIKMSKFTRMVKLRKSKEFFKPALYQLFILQQIAFVNKKGHRKYERYYISMGRKQGKSYLVSILLTYDFLMGKIPEINKEIILTSRSQDQARIIYKMVSDIIKSFIDLGAKDVTGRKIEDVIEVKKGSIENTETGASIQFYSSEADGIDGGEPDIGVIDEFALMKNGREVLKAIETGQNYGANPMLVMLSTVSDDLNSEMYKEYGLITKILDGDYDNDHYFIFVAELEELEEWKDEDNWSKANPLLIEESIREVAFRRIKQDMNDDLEKGHPLNKILMKVFNVWGKTSEEKYIDYDMWEDAIQEDYDKFGKRVYIGIDLSERSDLTGVSFLFEEESYIYVDTHAFVAGRNHDKGEQFIQTKSNSDNFDYEEAEREGHITINTNLIDYKSVWSYIVSYITENELDVKGLYFDPRFFDRFHGAMPPEMEGIHLEYVNQGWDTLTLPISEFRDNLIDGRILHSNNSFMNYCVKNANLKVSRNGRLIEKPSESLRIDSLAATITGYVDLTDYNFEDHKDSGIDQLLAELESGEFSFG